MHHDEQSQEWEHVKSPSPAEMDKMVEVIYTLLPKQFSKAHLEAEYAFLNQASNSPLPEMDYDIEHDEDDEKSTDSHVQAKLRAQVNMKGRMHHQKSAQKEEKG